MKRRSAHEICLDFGCDRERIERAVNGERWGNTIFAFEILTALEALLASWPQEDEHGSAETD